MGFVTLGIFIFQEQGLQGAILQMVNHGLITGGLFLLVGVIYERTHDRTIAKMGGLAGGCRSTPPPSASSSSPASGCRACPGSSASSWSWSARSPTPRWSAAIATSCMILAAGYLLWMFQRVFFGDLSDFLHGPGQPPDRHQPDRDPDVVPLATLIVRLRALPGPDPAH